MPNMAASQHPRASISVPVRNAAPWLAECLDSVLAQSERDFEVLAVDDGSDDGSAEILQHYALEHSRLRVLHTPPADRGIVAALNLALAQAAAPILVRMDADDRMHPDRVAKQCAVLDADPSLLGVASRAAAFPQEQLRDGMRAYLDWQNGLLTPEENARERFIESPILHPSVALRTDVVRERLGGWRDRGWPEDWDLFLRAMGCGLRIGRIPEVLVEWRLHPAQLTRQHPRYAESALLAARASFLADHLAAHVEPGRPIQILGAGPVGKALIKALTACGATIEGLTDVDPRKVGGVVRGGGHAWRVTAISQLRARSLRPFALSAVAGAPARAGVRAELASWGWREGLDFVVAA